MVRRPTSRACRPARSTIKVSRGGAWSPPFVATAFAQDDADSAVARWCLVAEQLRPKALKLVGLMDEAPGNSAANARPVGRTASLVRQRLFGHYGYYGRPHNCPALSSFCREVRRIWLRRP